MHCEIQRSLDLIQHVPREQLGEWEEHREWTEPIPDDPLESMGRAVLRPVEVRLNCDVH